MCDTRCIRYDCGKPDMFITFSKKRYSKMLCFFNGTEIQENGRTGEWFNNNVLGFMAYSRCALENWEEAEKRLEEAWEKEE